MAESFFGGRLEEVHFPELLQLISQRRETGVLRITHLKIKKDIYFHEGQIVFAKSNDPDERLGELLLRRGRISWKNLEHAASKIVPGKRLGTILVQEALIKPADLYHGVIDQVEEIIYSLFEWQEGEYDFTPGELPGKEDITLSISTPDVIAAGIGRVRRWSWIRKGVTSLQSMYRRNEDWATIVRKMTKTPEVQAVLTAMEHPMTLDEILTISPVSNFETCKLVWAFVVIGAVSPVSEEEAEAIATSRPVEQVSADEVSSSAPTVILQKEESLPPPVVEIQDRIEPEAPTPAPKPAIVTPVMPLVIQQEPEQELPPQELELPSPAMDLSFSDLAEFTDQAIEEPEAPPAPPPVDHSWEKQITSTVKNFNEIHRYLFEMIRMEVGAGVANFFSKVLKKTSTKYPLVFEGVQLNEFGEFQESSLAANIQGNLAENYKDAFDSLIREEKAMIVSFLDRKRIEAIEAGYTRILEKQKSA